MDHPLELAAFPDVVTQNLPSTTEHSKSGQCDAVAHPALASQQFHDGLNVVVSIFSAKAMPASPGYMIAAKEKLLATSSSGFRCDNSP